HLHDRRHAGHGLFRRRELQRGASAAVNAFMQHCAELPNGGRFSDMPARGTICGASAAKNIPPKPFVKPSARRPEDSSILRAFPFARRAVSTKRERAETMLKISDPNAVFQKRRFRIQ
ncbi:MAG: hypothetical protein PUK79_01605, partial [Clostridiales bacterium]|nr:hypothetical protein [Clostridiales bacterium]